MNTDLIKETEENLLGFVLRSGNPLCLVALQGKFYKEKHNLISSAILSLYRKDVKIDLLSVAGELEREQVKSIGLTDLAHLLNSAFIVDTEHPMNLIEENWKRRRMEKIFSDALQRVDTEDTKTLLSSMTEECISLSMNSEKSPTLQSAFDEMEQEMEDSLQAREEGRQTIGLQTGYKLDSLADGLRPAHIWTIAAYTSAGKTTLAVNIARFILEQKKRVVIYSLEATKTDIMVKFIALDTYLSTRDVLHAAENNAHYEKYQKSRDSMKKNYRLTIYDDKYDIDDICLSIRQENAKEHVDAVILDYVQNVSLKRSLDEYGRLTYAMSAFKRALNGTKSPMILFSQISNEDSKTKNALLMNGKGSGAIKAASSLFAYMKAVGSDEEIMRYYNTGEDVPFEIIVNKNQHGRLGTIRMKRKQQTGEIYEY